MKRLFFALWPDDETRKRIEKVNQSINSASLKKVKCGNFHVTLVFLGHVDAEAHVLISEGAQNISAQSFILEFDRLDYWQKPRILCLTATQYDAKLSALVDALRHVCIDCGIKIEERIYKPHITLARKALGNLDIDVDPIVWTAQSFCLLQSCSMPDGVQYQVLQRWQLNSSSGN